MRLKDKKAIVVGAGQTSGDTIGNGRATALLFAREGAELMCVDMDEASAQETVDLILKEGGKAFAHSANITKESDCKSIADKAMEVMSRIDILHNNVGIGTGDALPHLLEEETFDRIMNVNLKGMWMTCKHVLPVMMKQENGSIINISSAAAAMVAGLTTYEVTKAGVNKLTQSIAMSYAKYGIRCNAIMPDLLDTPMAIKGRTRNTDISEEEMREARNKKVPLRGKMGTAWDTAYAALYLASDESNFVTGVILPMDGGMSSVSN